MPSVFRTEGGTEDETLVGRYNGIRAVPRASRWMAGELVDDVHAQVEAPRMEISGAAIRARQEQVSPAIRRVIADQEDWNRRQAAALAHIVDDHYRDGRVISLAPRSGPGAWWRARLAALRAWACARICGGCR